MFKNIKRLFGGRPIKGLKTGSDRPKRKPAEAVMEITPDNKVIVDGDESKELGKAIFETRIVPPNELGNGAIIKSLSWYR